MVPAQLGHRRARFRAGLRRGRRVHGGAAHHLRVLQRHPRREQLAAPVLCADLLRLGRLRDPRRFHHRRRVAIHELTRLGANQGGRGRAHADTGVERGHAAGGGAVLVPAKAVPDAERGEVSRHSLLLPEPHPGV